MIVKIKPWVRHSKLHRHSAHLFNYFQVESKSPLSGKSGTFDVVETYDWVNVIPITSDGDIILVKQFRHGSESVTLELPGGAIGKGENPMKAGKRELLEETGCTSSTWDHLGTSLVNPAFMTNSCYYFLAKDCETNSEQQLDHLEEIEIVRYHLSKVPKLIEDSVINHSLVLAAFSHFQLKGNNFSF